MPTTQSTDTLIIGAGVIGCSIAYHLSKAGIQTTILERAEIAAEASSAAAGLLAPAGVLTGPKASANLFLASWSITPQLITEIEALSGVQVEYHRTGSLHVVMDNNDEPRLRSYAKAWQAQGADVTWLTGDQVHQYDPLLNPAIDTALYVPFAASIKPPLMTQSLCRSRSQTRCPNL